MHDPLDLTGVYRAHGTYRPNGRPFGAEVTITRLGEVYQLQWRSADLTWTGVGVVQGNVLAVAILSSSGNGVIAYDILPWEDGYVLHGTWAYVCDVEVSTETLTRIQAPPRPRDRRWFRGSTDIKAN